MPNIKFEVKFLSIALAVFIVLNLVLFAFGLINQLLFWSIIILIAIIAYRIIPTLNRRV